ncbi:anosmin-1-like isoform X2 [Macrosteles quadrilineatus]|uniref:anosmin-1-like isoform X2 n=1 Tax=Macrosteles quadrilineatus TaxID=74068 RepID=UPI0023E148F3|nr:anosmin-1-like isoform X2 [Macrosteles quadrilineatus]
MVHVRASMVVVMGVVCVIMGVGDARMDPLFRARCHATCIRQHDKIQCESECGLLTRSKPGFCPDRQNLRWHDKACIAACVDDVDCEETEKCCSNDCGTTCQRAIGLDQELVPSNLTVSDSKRQRAKQIQWVASATDGDVVYVLQQRSHVGRDPDLRLFGPWKPRSRRRRNRQLLTGLTPATWYQVRVAAVNSNGSRGYSQPSAPFKLQIDPEKPFEPSNLTAGRSGWVDGKLWTELRWRRAPSDLPLQHYKVFWSHCIKTDQEDAAAACKRNSVIVKHKTVNYKTTSFILKDLKPLSLYFIQVQAVTVPFGRKKLCSDKAVIFINTAKYKNATYNWRVQPERSVKDLRILNYYRSSPDTLEARVVWRGAAGRYLVKWSPHSSCEAAKNNPSNEATTEFTEFDIDNLEFDCKYHVSVSSINTTKKAMITITTPSCNQVMSKLSC